jgi:hypothetical protein
LSSFVLTENVKCRGRSCRGRIQGSGDFVHWFHLDVGRPRKDTALAVYLDGRIRPVITPDHPDQVEAELAAHGVNITAGQEAGMI